jgi:rod shape-determining protein MreD
MMPKNPQGGWIILASFLVAFVLTALPVPDWALPWRPAWVAMVLAYWCMAVPARVGVLTGWFVGVLLDVLTGALLGQHAVGLAVVAYFAVSYHKRLRVFSLIQQAVILGALLVVYVFLHSVVDRIAGIPYRAEVYLAALTSMLLWPWIFVVMRDIRRRGGVA